MRSPSGAWLLMALLCAAQSNARAEDPSPEQTGSTTPAEVPTIPVEPATAEPPASEAKKLDEVIVTSTKFKQSAREVAGGISVLSGDDLTSKGYQDAEDFLKLVPGVNLSGGDEGNDPKRITIRGVSNISGTTMTSGTFWGDVPFSDPFIARVTLDPNTFDLETVEVLKGPQGTLFGATALNGALRYVPVEPELGRLTVSGYAQGGNVVDGANGHNYGAVLNVPAGDELALRAVGFDRLEGGYIDEYNRHEKDVNAFHQNGYRGLLAWEPSTEWKVDLRHTAQNSRADDISFADNLDGRLERGNTPIPGPTKTSYAISSIGVTHPFSFAELYTQTGRTHKNFDTINDVTRNFAVGGPVGNSVLVKQVGTNESTGLMHETRLTRDVPESPWKWVAGVFGSRVELHEKGRTDQTDPTLGDSNLEHSTIDVTGDEIALFGELKYQFLRNWEAALGGRAFKTAVYGVVGLHGPLVAAANNGNPDLIAPGRIEEKHANPSASLAWTPTHDFMMFVAAARGFRFGGLNPLSSDATVTAPRTFKSDVIDNFEIGLRSRWFEQTLQADVGVYRLNWKDPQLFQNKQSSSSQYIDNVGGATGKGLEAAVQYRPPFLPGVTGSVSAAWSATETSVAFDDISGTTIQPGTQWPYAPRFQLASTLDYVFSLGAFQTKAGLVHTFIGPCYTDLTHSDVVMNYATMDFNLNVSSVVHPAWPALNLTVNNLRDGRGYYNIESLTDSTTNTTAYSPTYIRPRSITLRLTETF